MKDGDEFEHNGMTLVAKNSTYGCAYCAYDDKRWEICDQLPACGRFNAKMQAGEHDLIFIRKESLNNYIINIVADQLSK